ncbi:MULTISPECIES: hypothetical protein [unclassified Legionella]|uniref:hypothetical protein n=1 Tax=unclassified Legionella TaxID=2622702 RepID=UPI001054F3F0|nr:MULTISPECIES: hypothetical protein [unclassified Legionella]MDI9818078.1 hypothetical protein [Legionella sp. PL877]
MTTTLPTVIAETDSDRLDNHPLASLSSVNGFFHEQTRSLQIYREIMSTISKLNEEVTSLSKKLSHDTPLTYEDYFRYKVNHAPIPGGERELHEQVILLRCKILKIRSLSNYHLNTFNMPQQQSLQANLSDLITAFTAYAGPLTDYELNLREEMLAMIPLLHIKIYFFHHEFSEPFANKLFFTQITFIDGSIRTFHTEVGHLHPFFKQTEKIKTTIDVLKFLYQLREHEEAQHYVQLYKHEPSSRCYYSPIASQSMPTR